jgi:hypothetical protein
MNILRFSMVAGALLGCWSVGGAQANQLSKLCESTIEQTHRLNLFDFKTSSVDLMDQSVFQNSRSPHLLRRLCVTNLMSDRDLEIFWFLPNWRVWVSPQDIQFFHDPPASWQERSAAVSLRVESSCLMYGNVGEVVLTPIHAFPWDMRQLRDERDLRACRPAYRAGTPTSDRASADYPPFAVERTKLASGKVDLPFRLSFPLRPGAPASPLIRMTGAVILTVTQAQSGTVVESIIYYETEVRRDGIWRHGLTEDESRTISLQARFDEAWGRSGLAHEIELGIRPAPLRDKGALRFRQHLAGSESIALHRAYLEIRHSNDRVLASLPFAIFAEQLR